MTTPPQPRWESGAVQHDPYDATPMVGPTAQDIDLRLARADRHRSELGATFEAWAASGGFEFAKRDDPDDPTVDQWVLVLHRPLPREMAVIVGDFVHSLRATLDYLAGALLIANRADPTGSMFPMGAAGIHVNDWKGRCERWLGNAAADVLRRVTALELFPGGAGEDAWAVHELDRIDKHRLPILAGLQNRSVGLDVAAILRQMAETLGEDPTGIGDQWLHLKPAEPGFPVSDGFVAYSAPKSIASGEPQLVFEVALGEPTTFAGVEVGAALDRMRAAVSAIVDEFRGDI